VRDSPDTSWSPSIREREELRLLAGDYERFIGGEPAGDGRERPRVQAVSGETYMLVPPDGPERPWEDHRGRIGSCVVHQDLPTHISLAEDPCPFRVTSYLISAVPEHLYWGLFMDLLAARPELPRHLVWRSVKRWRVVRVRLNSVRVAFMTGRDSERFLPGGEPMLRHSTAAWGFVRWAHTRDGAALAVVESDPAGSRIASRLLFYCHAADALCDAGAIEVVSGIEVPRRRPRIDERGADGRRVLPRLLAPPTRKRPRLARWYDQLTRVWAGSRRRKARRLERRRARLSALTDVISRELALKEPDSDVRFRTRLQLIATWRMLFARPPRRRRWPLILLALPSAVITAVLHFDLTSILR